MSDEGPSHKYGRVQNRAARMNGGFQKKLFGLIFEPTEGEEHESINRNMASPAASAGLINSLKPRLRLQSTDIQAAALWGVAAGTTAIWLIQPFDWLKKTFFKKPEPEGNSQ
ncbi:hypothetical protein ACH5RR_016906 [Cinchona calisaya]|uniref:Ubiquinol-cytochrome c reductase complex 6.7 kDa protein n=1 Tax=Cinchona calisaya TaxID=153742 RepID=A0ABD3A0Y6_9GENT